MTLAPCPERRGETDATNGFLRPSPSPDGGDELADFEGLDDALHLVARNELGRLTSPPSVDQGASSGYPLAMKVSVEIPKAVEGQLAQVARRLNASPDELAAAAVRDLFSRTDEEFDGVASCVINKNRELYRRLA